MTQNTSNTSMPFYKNLKALRRQHGYTRNEIAQILGVTYQQIHKYETGLNRFPVEHIKTLKTLYNIEYQDFFEGLTNNETSSPKSEDEQLFQNFRNLKNKNLQQKIRKIFTILMDGENTRAA